MAVIEFGNVIVSWHGKQSRSPTGAEFCPVLRPNPTQALKFSVPIVTLAGTVTLLRERSPAKAESPIVVTVSGIVSVVMGQFSNA